MSTRLTDVERRERAMLEDQLLELLIDPETGLAPRLQWETFHVRPARTKKGWRTPAQGSMASGWPDLVLVRRRDRRLIFAELKRELEVPRPEQLDILQLLGVLAGEHYIGAHPTVRLDVAVWRPSDLRDPIETSVIGRVLA